jgi:hypothetical protein
MKTFERGKEGMKGKDKGGEFVQGLLSICVKYQNETTLYK